MENFEAHTKPLVEILAPTDNSHVYQFTIPIFQRGYEWTWGTNTSPGNASVLFSDIQNQTIRQLGFLTLHISRGKNNEKLERIIDGQQRLITTSLFLKAVRKVMYEKNPTNQSQLTEEIDRALWSIPNLRPRIIPEYSCSLFKAYADIMKDSYPQRKQKGLEEEENELIKGNKFLTNYQKAYQNLKAMDEGQLVNFATTLLRTPLLEVDVNDEDTAMNLFTTMNSTSKPLQDVDFYKDELFRNFREVDNKDDREFSFIWDRIYKKARIAFPSNAKDEAEGLQPLFEFYQKVLPPKQGWDAKGAKNKVFFSKNDFYYFKNSETALENLEHICDTLILLRNFNHADISRETEVNNLFMLFFQIGKEALIETLYVFLLATPKDDELKTFMRGLISLYILVKSGVTDASDKTLDNICCEITKSIYNSKMWGVTGSIGRLLDIFSENKQGFAKHFEELIYSQKNQKYIKSLLLFNTILQPTQAPIISNKKKSQKEIELTLDHIHPKDEGSFTAQEREDEETQRLIQGLGNLVLLEKDSNSSKGNGGPQKTVNIYENSIITDTRDVGKELETDLKRNERGDWDKQAIQGRLHDLCDNLFRDVKSGIGEMVDYLNDGCDFSEEQQTIYANLIDAENSPKFGYNNFVKAHIMPIPNLTSEVCRYVDPTSNLFMSVQIEGKPLGSAKTVVEEFSSSNMSEIYTSYTDYLLDNFTKDPELDSEITKTRNPNSKVHSYIRPNSQILYYGTTLSCEDMMKKMANRADTIRGLKVKMTFLK